MYISRKIERNYPVRWDEIFHVEGFHKKDWMKIEREYDRMAEFAASIAAGFVVLHIPQKGPWMEKHRYPAARLSAWAAKRNVRVLDLLPVLERASARQRLYYEKDGHCTPAGEYGHCRGAIQILNRAEIHPLDAELPVEIQIVSESVSGHAFPR